MVKNFDVWLFILSLSSGGTERNLINLANYFHKQDVNVTVVTVFRDNPLRDELSEDIEFRSLGIPAKLEGEDKTQVKSAEQLYHYPFAVLKFLWQVRKHRPDIIQSYLFYDNNLARLAKFISPETIVITGIRAVPTDRSILKTIIDGLTIPLSNHIISNSEAGKSMAIDLGASSSEVSVIYNAKDIKEFRIAEKSNIRDEFDIPPGDMLCGNVARLIKRKGHHELLEAWSTADIDRTISNLIIVGEGPEYGSLQARVQQLGISNSVYLVGYREDVPGLLQSLDYFVFPSHFEGLPGALIEAMAAGLPIVATNVPGNRELIDDKETGVLANPRDAEDLKNKLELITNDESLAIHISKNAKRAAMEKFSIEKPAQEHIELYKFLLRSGDYYE